VHVTWIKVSCLGQELDLHFFCQQVHSIRQKYIALKFSKSRAGSDVRYSCHHNSSPHSRSFTVRKTLFTCPSSGASLSARSLTLLAYTTNASLSSYDKQLQPSTLFPFHLNANLFPYFAAHSPKKCPSHISFAVYQNCFQLSCSKVTIVKTFKN
jgi:hypothetical protein